MRFRNAAGEGARRMKLSRSQCACIAGVLLFAAPVLAAVTAITVANTQPLAFGSFAAGTGGSITMSPSGARSASGGIVLISSAVGSAAQFTVSGDPDLTYSITLPANGTADLKNSSGQSMGLTNFTSNPSGIGQLSATGKQTVSVGATLNVGAQQAPGAYTGVFDVTVDYN